MSGAAGYTLCAVQAAKATGMLQVHIEYRSQQHTKSCCHALMWPAASGGLSCRKQVEAGKLAAPAAAQQLQHLQDKSSLQLSARSQQLLALAGDAQAQQQFAVDSSGQAAAGSLSCITCMDAVRQAKDEVSPAVQIL
jgi:hypothetical protein